MAGLVIERLAAFFDGLAGLLASRFAHLQPAYSGRSGQFLQYLPGSHHAKSGRDHHA